MIHNKKETRKGSENNNKVRKGSHRSVASAKLSFHFSLKDTRMGIMNENLMKYEMVSLWKVLGFQRRGILFNNSDPQASSCEREGKKERFTTTVERNNIFLCVGSDIKQMKMMLSSKHYVFVLSSELFVLPWVVWDSSWTRHVVGHFRAKKVNAMNTPMERKWKRKAHYYLFTHTLRHAKNAPATVAAERKSRLLQKHQKKNLVPSTDQQWNENTTSKHTFIDFFTFHPTLAQLLLL